MVASAERAAARPSETAANPALNASRPCLAGSTVARTHPTPRICAPSGAASERTQATEAVVSPDLQRAESDREIARLPGS
jgi:hypothetical protein